MGFLRSMQFERLSFWFGFLAGILFLWLLGKLKPGFRQFREFIKKSFQSARAEMQTGTEVRHRNDTIRHAQSMHLANPMFSLDEVVIEPRLLAPPAPVVPGVLPPPLDITEKVLPYMPDWSGLASVFGAPTLSLADALQGGMNLAILGEPGCGKTVALAYLACQLARQAPELGPFKDYVPFFVHAADLVLPPRLPESILDTLVDAVSAQASALTLPRLAKFMHLSFEQGRVILLVDGLDELNPSEGEQVLGFLCDIYARYPEIHIVLAADWVTPGLRPLKASLLGLAGWDERQRIALIHKWGDLWMRWIRRPSSDGSQPLQPEVINSWLATDQVPLSPLELTLKAWAAYAGDTVGPGAAEAVEAYLRRMAVGIPKWRQALEQLASQMVITMRPVMSSREAQSALSAFDPAPAVQASESQAQPGDSPEKTAGQTAQPAPRPAAQEGSPTPRVLPALVDNGLLHSHAGGRIRLIHPSLLGYLASYGLGSQEECSSLLAQPDWMGRRLALQYIASRQEISSWLAELITSLEKDPLQSGLFMVARWAPYAPELFPWRAQVLRQLAGMIQDKGLSTALRGRALAAMVSAGSSASAVLFRQVMTSSDAETRTLAALAAGWFRDSKALQPLCELLSDLTPQVRQAACLGLVAIGDEPALEAVASGLLHGDESLRMAAAEALANNPEEGYPVLDEGSRMNDLMVRRACVSGLARLKQQWAIDILHMLQIEDNQWVVQNAATQALEEIAQPNPRIPGPLPELTETPWLIAFAGEHGIGVAPGKPARDLVFKALKEGGEEQKLAAVEYLRRYGDENAILHIYEFYFSNQEEVRETAFLALWELQAAGIPLPEPIQFGLH